VAKAQPCELSGMPTGKSPGPAGTRAGSGQVEKANQSLGAAPAIDTSAPEYLEFMARVLEAAIADRVRKGRKFFSEVPSTELVAVEKGKVMRTEAAAQCIQLLKDAREALGAEQWGPPADEQSMTRQNLARKVHSIGVASAYRAFARDKHVWTQDCFPKYYRETYAARAAAPGGLHGDKAVQLMVRYFSPRKAPPGFSNHSNGNAVDFMTKEGRVTFSANTSQRAGWRKTWLHQWLVLNAQSYGFHPLESEEWHWDYR